MKFHLANGRFSSGRHMPNRLKLSAILTIGAAVRWPGKEKPAVGTANSQPRKDSCISTRWSVRMGPHMKRLIHMGLDLNVSQAVLPDWLIFRESNGMTIRG